jgi:hypothetical protein
MRWAMLVAGSSMVGCGDDYPPPDPLPAEYTACEADADCVVTELGCCDECNGGFAVAVRSDRQAEVVDLYSERCGGDTACTEMGCQPWVVTCDAGTCGAARGTPATY